MNIHSYTPIGNQWVALDAYGSICGVLKPVPCLDITQHDKRLKIDPSASQAHVVERVNRNNAKRADRRRQAKQ